jgi:hypothetical protein
VAVWDKETTMPQRLFALVSLFLALLLAGPPAVRPAAPAAQSAGRYFPETRHTVQGVFLDYWTTHGGLAQQGYPLTEEFREVNKLDGKTYTVQYFERAVFEHHPEHAGTPYEVLLTQLGTFERAARYPAGSNPAAAPVGPPRLIAPPTLTPVPAHLSIAIPGCADRVAGRGTTFVCLSSEAGDPVGRGRMYLLLPGDGTFTALLAAGRLEVSTPAADGWSLEFGPRLGQPLQVGTYPNARENGSIRHPWVRAHPFQASTIYDVTAQFEILELAADAEGRITRLAINFEQRTTIEGSGMLAGAIRINSTVLLPPAGQARPPSPTPTPPASAGPCDALNPTTLGDTYFCYSPAPSANPVSNPRLFMDPRTTDFDVRQPDARSAQIRIYNDEGDSEIYLMVPRGQTLAPGIYETGKPDDPRNLGWMNVTINGTSADNIVGQFQILEAVAGPGGLERFAVNINYVWKTAAIRYHATPSLAEVRHFPATGHSVQGAFLRYWLGHGGLAQQGYPLTEPFSETNKLNGATYRVQYFERAVFEWHPENQAPYDVLLSQLGKFELEARYPAGSNPAAAPVAPPGGGPVPTVPVTPSANSPIRPAACLDALRGVTGSTYLCLDSRPGEYIGAGRLWVIKPSEARFQVWGRLGVLIDHDVTADYWRLGFTAPDGGLLVPGLYPDAQLEGVPVPGHPSLEVAGRGAGCSRTRGQFHVLELAMNPTTGVVERAAVNFEQYCDENAAPLYGILRFNATIGP